MENVKQKLKNIERWVADNGDTIAITASLLATGAMGLSLYRFMSLARTEHNRLIKAIDINNIVFADAINDANRKICKLSGEETVNILRPTDEYFEELIKRIVHK